MTYSGNDFYCDVALSGKAEIDIVEETEDVLAFHHTNPFWPVHIVVIPKAHIPSLLDMGDHDDAILSSILLVVRKIARKVNEQYGAASIMTNLGDYQDSKHLHFHINYGKPLRDDNRDNEQE